MATADNNSRPAGAGGVPRPERERALLRERLMEHSYTSGQAARICGLGVSTIKRWVKRGALRAYRTPGGDLRIRRDHLLDFMREYGIPMHHLEKEERAEPRRVLVYLECEADCRAAVAAFRLAGEEVEVTCVDTDLDFGVRLAAERPGYVVLRSRGRDADAQRLLAVRSTLEPRPVRVALVVDGAAAGERPDLPVELQPEVVIAVGPDAAWASRLAADLLGLPALCGREQARRAG